MLSKELHPLNALLPILVTLSGMSILSKDLQPPNAFSPISVTPSGISILFKELHPLNALLPILVTLFGMSMLFNELHPLNAPPISVTLSGIIYVVLLCFGGKQMIDVNSLLNNTPSINL